ncbi:DNA-binding anti-repressor SinI [Bacillus carboniphilus]|uniref:DNA-binding anti-repressor SinI n=1 Tax=Bacillus carboniphilus TaxID=86663 RepID=A0ABY9JWZ3_9BACI|nr:DNA-binding anti-repressor SinI [Bacillus carboniphilus]WLR43911.1 DNA-binding anti-repressor SinI [Bacillus carboniphilus]
MEQIQQLDEEWVELILSARSIGMTYDEIKTFIHNPQFFQQQLKDK